MTLCKEYALSVINNPKKGKHYSEWLAEKQRIPTRRSLIKDDVDRAIMNSRTFTQFVKNLKEMDYEVKTNVKHIAVKPPGAPRFFRLHNLSKEEDYSEDGIKERILSNALFIDGPAHVKKRTFYFHDHFEKQKKLKGIKALYFHYMYRMGIIKNHAPSKVHFLLKEDLRYMDKITKEATLLGKQQINTLEELEQKESEVTEKLERLVKERRCLYNKVKRCRNFETKAMIQQDIEVLSNEIKELRKEVRLYGDIKKRSTIMKDKLEKIQKEEMEQAKADKHRHRQSKSI